jgi:hypothetical protein
LRLRPLFWRASSIALLRAEHDRILLQHVGPGSGMNRQRVVPLQAATGQLTLTFEVGTVERHHSAMDVVRRVAYNHPSPLKTLAADMDMSQSTLSRKLSQDPDDPRRFTVDDLEKFIVATGDASVVEYLAAKYLQSDETRQANAVAKVESLLRELSSYLPAIKGAA